MNATANSMSIRQIAIRSGWMTLVYLAGGLTVTFFVTMKAPRPSQIV